MRVDRVDAVVLHSRSWRESSQLLDIFTAEYGRVSLVARGSRGGTRGRSALAPFNLYHLSWAGRGELKTLTDRETRIQWQLAGERALCGLYVNELLCKILLNEDPHPQLFASYLQTCDGLDRAADSAASLLRRFEISLLSEMGYAISLIQDSLGEGLRPDSYYSYQAEQGWVADQAPSADALPGSCLLALEKGEQPASLEQSRRLRQLLQQLIDQLLDYRPLQSRELLLQYRLKKG